MGIDAGSGDPWRDSMGMTKIRVEREICAGPRSFGNAVQSGVVFMHHPLVALVHSHVGGDGREVLESCLLSHVHSLLLVCIAVHVLHLS